MKIYQYTGVWKYYGVYNILPCLFRHRLNTKMLTIHVLSVFTITTSRALGALTPLGLFIAKTLTHLL